MERCLIHPGVHIGENARVGDYVVIGALPDAPRADLITTVIGPNCDVRSHCVIYAGSVIGENFRAGHGAVIREMNSIGNDVSIGNSSVLESNVTIGDRARVHSNALVAEYSVIEEDAWLGPGVVLTNARYPRSRDSRSNWLGPHVLAGAKVCANATVLPGVVVGRNALVGAGSVVVHDVPHGKVVAGNPARVINDVVEIGAYTGDRHGR